MVTPEQYSLNIERILKLERENMQLRAMLIARDDEVTDLKQELKDTLSMLDLWQGGKA